MNTLRITDKSSVFLPPLTSCLALVIVCNHLWLFGAERASDAGASAHIFQLLITAQVPIIAAFAIRNGTGQWRSCLTMALQIGAAAVVIAAVWWFDL